MGFNADRRRVARIGHALCPEMRHALHWATGMRSAEARFGPSELPPTGLLTFSKKRGGAIDRPSDLLEEAPWCDRPAF
jgi:hypothetical protein